MPDTTVKRPQPPRPPILLRKGTHPSSSTNSDRSKKKTFFCVLNVKDGEDDPFALSARYCESQCSLHATHSLIQEEEQNVFVYASCKRPLFNEAVGGYSSGAIYTNLSVQRPCSIIEDTVRKRAAIYAPQFAVKGRSTKSSPRRLGRLRTSSRLHSPKTAHFPLFRNADSDDLLQRPSVVRST